MKWNHIMDCQPEHGREIIQVDPPYEDGNYCIGMREYGQLCSFEDVLKFCSDNDLPDPNFWWIYIEDFPFPKAPKKIS